MTSLTNRFKKRKTIPPDIISLVLIILVLSVAVIFSGCSKSTEPEPGPSPAPGHESESYIGPEITILSPPRAGMIKAGDILRS